MSFPSFATGEVLTATDMNAVGLWRITTATVSGTTFSVNNCFSNDYENYRVVLQGLTGAAVGTSFRLRVAGADNNSLNYFSGWEFITWGGGSSGVYGDSANANFQWAYADTNPQDFVFEFYRPFQTAWTGFSALGYAPDSMRSGAGRHQVAASFTGFSIINTGGWTGGKITVYGYNKG